MARTETAARLRGWLIALALLGTALAIWPDTLRPFMLPKLTLLVLVALGIVWAWLNGVVVGRRLFLPRSISAALLAAFVVASAIATVASVRPMMSLIGASGRYSGLLTYVCYGILCIAALSFASEEWDARWRKSLLVSAGVVAGFGLVQAMGGEPFGFLTHGLPGAFSTLGQVNFAGAWIGAVGSLILVALFDARTSWSWRTYSACLLLASMTYAIVTTTSQALVVMAVSIGWAGALLALAHEGIRAWVSNHKPSMAGVMSGVLLALIAGAWVLRARLAAALDQALVERPDFWATAIDIWRDHPIVGTGLDTYGQFFPSYRPSSHALIPGAGTADAPHSVPLAMLSNGGVLLATTYIAFVVIVGVALLRGAIRGDASTRRTLAAWGGVWLGYQAQSLVSFDVPPLGVLHFVSAGVIVSVAVAPKWREVMLPGASDPAARRGRGAQPGSTRALQTAVAVFGVVAAWLALVPLRADVIAASAKPLVERGLHAQALERFNQAARLNPAEPSYPLLAAQALAASGQLEQSFSRVVEAANRAPGEVEYAIFAARIADETGWSKASAKWYREAAERDPKNVDVLTEVADFFLEQNQPRDARSYLRAALSIDGSDPTARQLLRRLEG